jgi:sec-independent protein translocase protein TatA
MFSSLKGWEIPAILIIVLLLFGGKKLPEAARGLGRSLRILKSETKGLNTDESTDAPEASSAQEPAKPTAAPVDRTEA